MLLARDPTLRTAKPFLILLISDQSDQSESAEGPPGSFLVDEKRHLGRKSPLSLWTLWSLYVISGATAAIL